MDIPVRIQKVLDEWNITYKLSSQAKAKPQAQPDSTSNLPKNTALICLLEDNIGRIQVIFPACRLLDLNKVMMATAREFTPINQEKLTAIQRNLNLEVLPALPQMTDLDTYVDESLLKLKTVQIVIAPDQAIEIPSTDFKAITSSANLGVYASAIPKTDSQSNNWLEADTKRINEAVATFTKRRIEQRLEETLDMPPMPETARQIIELRLNPDAETEQLATLVSSDPGLTAQVISWANSPYYGGAGTVSSVQEAIIRMLGFNLVINLALGLSLGRTLEVPKNGPEGYTPFWYESIYNATLMSELLSAVPADIRPQQGMAYLCGLLHNFGYLILAHVFPPHLQLINRHIEANPHVHRNAIEQHLLGITREQISANLFKQWGMPEEVFTAIRYQNEPQYAGEHSVLSKMLYISSRLLRQRGLGQAPLENITDSIVASLRLDMAKAEAGVEKVLDSKDDLEEMAHQLQSA